MKFITGIKKHDLKVNCEIRVPMYHRTSISLFNNTEAYYFIRHYQSSGFHIREVIVTPLIPDSWHVIRKITISSIDAPGIISIITTKLRDLKINVNIQEAVTTQVGALYNITLLVDFTYYLQDNNITMEASIPEETIQKVKKELMSLKNPKTGEQIINNHKIVISELTFLESISKVAKKENSSQDSGIQFRDSAKQKIRNHYCPTKI